jgi:hypothetical protein
MAHAQQIQFVSDLKDQFPEFFVNKKVLEIGSLDLNGSIRSFFENCRYLGVDVGPGPGVDLIARGEDLEFSGNYFDVVASTECFEHTPNWARILNNMIRMSKGLVFFTCATTGRAEHGTTRCNPWDSPHTAGTYYHNVTEEEVLAACDLSALKTYAFSTNHESHDLYFYGIKGETK